MKLPHSQRAAWFAASALLASAVPASAEIYLTEEQALGVIFGDNAAARKEEHVIDDALRARLEHVTNLKFPERSCTFFAASKPGQPQKFAIVMNEIGKSEPITFMVGMSDQGKVTEVVIMVFRENRGWEVKEKRFLNQFRGKTIRNAIRVDEDIINYTGATLSSKAVARGVKRALALLNAFYLDDAHPAPSASGFAKPLPVKPILQVINSNSKESPGLFRQMRYAMGTVCEIRMWCASPEDAGDAFNLAFGEIERLEQVFSAYREDSELSRVNREAGMRAVPIGEDFFSLTQYAVRSWQESEGASDITVGPLMKLWGLREREPKHPTQEQIAQACLLIGCNKLELDTKNQAIRFQKPGMELDFGGLAKGYTAERVGGLLHSLGTSPALVSLGKSSLHATEVNSFDGDNFVEGEPALPFGHWMIGIPDPTRMQGPPIYIALGPGESLATSGTDERNFSIEGEKRSHILDPRTGYPLSGVGSVTAITKSGVRSEAFAKQLLISSLNAGLGIVKLRRSNEWISLQVQPDNKLKLDFNLRRGFFQESA